MTLLASVDATEAMGAAIGDVLRPGDVVALSGPLGAGKTTLVRGLLRSLGVTGDVPSPTFAIVIPYVPPETRIAVAHVDLYRIEDSSEFEELALDDALSDSALIIEWPERLGDRLWTHALRLNLDAEGEARRLTAQVPPAWEGRWSA